MRLAKLVRLIRVINLMRKKIQKDTYLIGNEQEGNKSHNINAEHIKEQVTSVITVKVSFRLSRQRKVSFFCV